MTTSREILDCLLLNHAVTTQYIPWGKGHRNVIIINSKKYSFKPTGAINKRFGHNILPLYISMSSNLLMTNLKLNEEHAVQVIFNIRFQNEDKHRTYSRDVFHVKCGKKAF